MGACSWADKHKHGALSPAAHNRILNKLPTPKSLSQVHDRVTLTHQVLGQASFPFHVGTWTADVNSIQNIIYDVDNGKFTSAIIENPISELINIHGESGTAFGAAAAEAGDLIQSLVKRLVGTSALEQQETIERL